MIKIFESLEQFNEFYTLHKSEIDSMTTNKLIVVSFPYILINFVLLLSFIINNYYFKSIKIINNQLFWV